MMLSGYVHSRQAHLSRQSPPPALTEGNRTYLHLTLSDIHLTAALFLYYAKVEGEDGYFFWSPRTLKTEVEGVPSPGNDIHYTTHLQTKCNA